MGPVDPVHVRLDIDETEAWLRNPAAWLLPLARQSGDLGAALVLSASGHM